MMQVFRQAAASWAAKLLIGCLAVSFGIWGVNDIFRGYHRSALASVGNYQIPADVFQRSLQQRLRMISRQSGQSITAERAREIGLDRQFLAEMLRDGTLEEQARHLKLAVPDTVVTQDIANQQAFQNARGEFDTEKFRRILRENGLNEQMFLHDEKAARMREAVATAVVGDLIVPKTLVQAVVQQANEQRDAKYFVVTANEADVASPGDADLKKFYTDNAPLFTAPAYRSLVILKIEPKDLTGTMTVTDEEIAKAYEVRKDEYRTPEHRSIEQITFPTIAEAQIAKNRLAQGADFLAIAKERGLQDKDVILGDLKTSDIVDKNIADAAFSLAQGAVSDPVKGKLSIALLRVTKIVPESVKSLDEVRNDIVQKVKLDRARDEILSIHDKVEDERAGGASFEDIAKKLSVPLIAVPAIDAQGRDKGSKAVEGIPAKNDVLKLAFESDVGVENDSISTQDDGSVWVDVRDVVAPALKPFDQVKAEAEKAVKAQKVREKVLAKARDFVKRAEAGTSIETLAQESNAQVKTELGLKRNETSANFDVEAISALFTTADNGYAFSPLPDGKGAIVMQAQPVMNPPFDPKSKQTEAVHDALKQGLTNDMLALYVADLQKRLGVSVNDSLWQQVTGGSQ